MPDWAVSRRRGFLTAAKTFFHSPEMVDGSAETTSAIAPAAVKEAVLFTAQILCDQQGATARYSSAHTVSSILR
jgi:hypothetical protein